MYHEDNCKVSKGFLTEVRDAFRTYKSEKEILTQRVRENMIFYKGAYERLYNEKENATQPATAFVLSAVENKYADYIDNFPGANFLAREEGDEETAKLLTEIMPFQLEMSGNKKAYKQNVRQKLISGTGVYGVFWSGLDKNIHIKRLDFMSVFCDMNVDDIQDSRFVFVVSAVDNEKLKKMYPKYSDMFDGDFAMDGYEEQKMMNGYSEIVDCYYKTVEGKLHLLKFCNDVVIDSTEGMDGFEDGLYKHGKYPIVLDVMYPESKGPFGFSLVDIVKNPQRYIDRLDGAILKNALLASHPKWLVQKNADVNTEQLTDMNNEVVEAMDIDEEAIRKMEVASVPQNVMQHRQTKIEELKEVSSNRDFSQGGTTGGVTSAKAITALQETGNKTSRAQIDDSFDAYKEVVSLVIELMREFFDKDRIYRIIGTDGKPKYKNFSKMNLTGAKPVTDSLGFVMYSEQRDIAFDIEIVPQRKNTYQKESQNQLFMTLWQSGFFNINNIDTSIIALKNMSFDGKDNLIRDLEGLRESRANNMQNPPNPPVMM